MTALPSLSTTSATSKVGNDAGWHLCFFSASEAQQACAVVEAKNQPCVAAPR